MQSTETKIGSIYRGTPPHGMHAKAFIKRVDSINARRVNPASPAPRVELAPLPGGAQFLNVIESVFSGRKGLATRFEGLPDVHYGNEQHFVDEDANTSMSKWLLTGTTPKGTKAKVQGCDFYTFRDDGKVIRKDSYWKIVD